MIGSGIDTIAQMRFNDAFVPGLNPGFPDSMTFGDGDGVVPTRSALRSTVWELGQHTPNQSSRVQHWVYKGMGHASCLLFLDSPAAQRCFGDVLALIKSAQL